MMSSQDTGQYRTAYYEKAGMSSMTEVSEVVHADTGPN